MRAPTPPPTLSQRSIRQIYDVLEGSHFSASNFRAVFHHEGQVLFSIAYLDHPEYEFQVSEGNVGDDAPQWMFILKFSPGELKHDDSDYVSSFEDVKNKLAAWCGILFEEIRASSFVFDQLEKMKKEFAERLDAIDKNARFTNGEIKDIQTKLEELSKAFAELQKRNTITEEELKTVKETIGNLQATANQLPKKAWYRSAGSKLIDLGGRILQSPQGQKLLTDVGQRLIDNNLPPHHGK